MISARVCLIFAAFFAHSIHGTTTVEKDHFHSAGSFEEAEYFVDAQSFVLFDATFQQIQADLSGVNLLNPASYVTVIRKIAPQIRDLFNEYTMQECKLDKAAEDDENGGYGTQMLNKFLREVEHSFCRIGMQTEEGQFQQIKSMLDEFFDGPTGKQFFAEAKSGMPKMSSTAALSLATETIKAKFNAIVNGTRGSAAMVNALKGIMEKETTGNAANNADASAYYADLKKLWANIRAETPLQRRRRRKRQGGDAAALAIMVILVIFSMSFVAKALFAGAALKVIITIFVGMVMYLMAAGGAF